MQYRFVSARILPAVRGYPRYRPECLYVGRYIHGPHAYLQSEPSSSHGQEGCVCHDGRRGSHSNIRGRGAFLDEGSSNTYLLTYARVKVEVRPVLVKESLLIHRLLETRDQDQTHWAIRPVFCYAARHSIRWHGCEEDQVKNGRTIACLSRTCLAVVHCTFLKCCLRLYW